MHGRAATSPLARRPGGGRRTLPAHRPMRETGGAALVIRALAIAAVAVWGVCGVRPGSPSASTRASVSSTDANVYLYKPPATQALRRRRSIGKVGWVRSGSARAQSVGWRRLVQGPDALGPWASTKPLGMRKLGKSSRPFVVGASPFLGSCLPHEPTSQLPASGTVKRGSTPEQHQGNPYPSDARKPPSFRTRAACSQETRPSPLPSLDGSVLQSGATPRTPGRTMAASRSSPATSAPSARPPSATITSP